MSKVCAALLAVSDLLLGEETVRVFHDTAVLIKVKSVPRRMDE